MNSIEELYTFFKVNYKWGVPATFGWLVMFLHGLKTKKFDIWSFSASLSAALLVGYLTQIICVKIGYQEYIGAVCSLTGLMSDGIVRFWMNNDQNILSDIFRLVLNRFVAKEGDESKLEKKDENK